MAKFFGKIGYVVSAQSVPGVWSDDVTEKDYYGDVIKNTTKWQGSEKLNDDLNVNNQISIVADPFAYDHIFALKYVVWMGSKWKITTVDIQQPRLILTIGGVYTDG